MLATDVREDLERASGHFQGLVWPMIRDWCGGGALATVETARGEAPLVCQYLDMFAGCDYLQKADDGLIYGIAARVQFVERSYDTFTVRRTRYSGAETEFAKRCAALDRAHLKPICPPWTVHAYVTRGQPARLLSVAAVRTLALFQHIRTGHEGTDWWLQRTANGRHGAAEFICVAWDALPEYHRPLIWRAS